VGQMGGEAEARGREGLGLPKGLQEGSVQSSEDGLSKRGVRKGTAVGVYVHLGDVGGDKRLDRGLDRG